MACFWKYASRICSAAGAADSAPKPPSSTVTMVTIRGSGYGARTAYQDWSAWPGRCAVPVLPATSTGKPPKTPYEVPGGPGRPGAALRGSRAAVAGAILTWRARLRVEFLQHPAGGVLDFHADVRGDDRAVVAERGVGDRQLQRVGLQVALAGRQLDVVAGRPGPFGVAFGEEFVAPLPARHQAFDLAGRCRARLASPIPSFRAHFCSWLVCPTSAGRVRRRRRRRRPAGPAPGSAARRRRRRRSGISAPPSSIEPPSKIGSSGVITPPSSAARAVMILKVEPVG